MNASRKSGVGGGQGGGSTNAGGPGRHKKFVKLNFYSFNPRMIPDDIIPKLEFMNNFNESAVHEG